MIAIIILAGAILASVVAGVIALVRVGIAREESDNSLRGKPATRSAALTRRLVGLCVRMPQNVTQADQAADQTDAGQGQRPPTNRRDR